MNNKKNKKKFKQSPYRGISTGTIGSGLIGAPKKKKNSPNYI